MLIYTGYERKPFRAVVGEEREKERGRERKKEKGKKENGKGGKRKGEKRRLSTCINANISHRFV